MKNLISYIMENRILKKLILSKSTDKEILRTTEPLESGIYIIYPL